MRILPIAAVLTLFHLKVVEEELIKRHMKTIVEMEGSGVVHAPLSQRLFVFPFFACLAFFSFSKVQPASNLFLFV